METSQAASLNTLWLAHPPSVCIRKIQGRLADGRFWPEWNIPVTRRG